jgi:hypothetical protein
MLFALDDLMFEKNQLECLYLVLSSAIEKPAVEKIAVQESAVCIGYIPSDYGPKGRRL